MFTSASEGILLKDCVTFYEFTAWFWHSSSSNFTGICFTHPCSLRACSFSEFHKTSWMKRIPLWQHPSIVSQALSWKRFVNSCTLKAILGAASWCFLFGVTCKHLIYWAKFWKSCPEGSKHWQTAKRAVWKERHLLFLRNNVGWEKKVSSSSVHISVLLQLVMFLLVILVFCYMWLIFNSYLWSETEA